MLFVTKDVIRVEVVYDGNVDYVFKKLAGVGCSDTGL